MERTTRERVLQQVQGESGMVVVPSQSEMNWPVDDQSIKFDG
jgi:hypothetical protein